MATWPGAPNTSTVGCIREGKINMEPGFRFSNDAGSGPRMNIYKEFRKARNIGIIC